MDYHGEGDVKMASKRVRTGEHYQYPTGKYVREKLGDKPSDAIGYRVVPVKGKPGRKVLIAIRRKRGPQGGRTKAIALLRSKKTAKGKRLAARAKRKRRA